MYVVVVVEESEGGCQGRKTMARAYPQTTTNDFDEFKNNNNNDNNDSWPMHLVPCSTRVLLFRFEAKSNRYEGGAVEGGNNRGNRKGALL